MFVIVFQKSQKKRKIAEHSFCGKFILSQKMRCFIQVPSANVPRRKKADLALQSKDILSRVLS